ncbi:hypothetical protein GCM10009785_23260 [Brooklawnia cerclae]|uniref:Uncharacterized protein n=1 Tax=Brooklawnia cerclae TaxID=349934 RepID=A0ABX0SFA4_9ACTN|nr:hypothetical protein [Brooklawnia cerclae]NIH57039.1 hypothetical protein [Brooklawnia cerclae]
MAHQNPDPGPDERALGQRPGVNQNPLSPSFVDGPRRSPASSREMFVALIGIVVIVAVVAVVLSVVR